MNQDLTYKTILEEVLNDCGINNVDQEIEKANLYFGISKKTLHNQTSLNTNYIRILNQMDIHKLTMEEQEEMKQLNTIDEKKIFIHKTLKKVLMLGNEKNKDIVVKPHSLGRIIPNGVLALEIVVGRNTKELEKEEFIRNMKEQRKFLEELNRKYTKWITDKLNYPVIIFIGKDM